MATFVCAALGLWYKMRFSIEALSKEQGKHATMLETIMNDRTAMAVLHSRVQAFDDRFVALGARTDSYHARLHDAENKLADIDVLKTEITWLKRKNGT